MDYLDVHTRIYMSEIPAYFVHLIRNHAIAKGLSTDDEELECYASYISEYATTLQGILDGEPPTASLLKKLHLEYAESYVIRIGSNDGKPKSLMSEFIDD